MNRAHTAHMIRCLARQTHDASTPEQNMIRATDIRTLADAIVMNTDPGNELLWQLANALDELAFAYELAIWDVIALDYGAITANKCRDNARTQARTTHTQAA